MGSEGRRRAPSGVRNRADLAPASLSAVVVLLSANRRRRLRSDSSISQATLRDLGESSGQV